MILFLILLVFAISNVAGQVKFPSKEEFYLEIGKANDKGNKLQRRETNTTKFLDSGRKVEKIFTRISEIIPDKKERTIEITEEKNKLTERSENILIGEMQYTRKDQGSWMKKDLSKVDAIKGQFRITGESQEIKKLNEYIISTSVVDNKKQSVYYNCDVSLRDNILYFFETKYWINEDGLIFKSQIAQRNTTPDGLIELTDIIYEYNPKDLKIEAPIK